METYRYRVAAPDGRVTSASAEAESPSALKDRVERGGQFLLDWERVGPSAGTGGRVGPRDLHLFTREIHILLKSGMTLPDALATLEGPLENRRLSAALADVRRRMQSGEGFSQALAAHPDLFDPFYVRSIRAGEVAGALLPILEKLAAHLKRATRLREKLTQAIAYPAVLACVSLGVIGFLVFYVVPVFRVVFEDLKLEVPLFTRALMGLSVFVKTRGLTLLAATAGLVALAAPTGGLALLSRLAGRSVLRLPVIGRIAARYEVARFASTLALLLAGGLPALESLKILRDTAPEPDRAGRFDRTMRALSEGRDLSGSLAAEGLVDPVAARLVHVGERSGSLPAMLEAAAEFHEEGIDRDVELLSSLAEPLLVGAMGAVVAAIVLSVFLPIIRMSTAF